MAGNTARDGNKLHAGTASRLKTLWAQASANPHWVAMDALSRFATVRDSLRLLRRRPDLSRYDLAASRMANIEPRECLASLRRDGYFHGLTLPADVVGQLHAFASDATCYGDADVRAGFRYADKIAAQVQCERVFSQATYLFLDEMQSVIDGVATDPLLSFIAASYMNAPPVVTGRRLWWVFATAESDYNTSLTTSFFHYDKDDYAALRWFFYLSPVPDRNHGPHVVVRGSHTDKRLSQLFSLGERGDHGILNCYGPERMDTILGDAGSGFAEDPFCFHKATRPLTADRLMLEIRFATRNFDIFPHPDRAAARNVALPAEVTPVGVT